MSTETLSSQKGTEMFSVLLSDTTYVHRDHKDYHKGYQDGYLGF